MAERSRADIEKSKISFEQSESASTAQSAEKETQQLKQTLQKALEAVRANLVEQFEEELNDYKLELEQERKMERERVDSKIARELDAEKTKLKLESNQRAINILEERNRQEAAIRDKYAKMRKATEEEYDRRPRANISSSGDTVDEKRKTTAELRLNEDLARLRRQLKDDLDVFASGLRLEQSRVEAKTKQELETEKSEYDDSAEDRMRRAAAEHSDFKISALGTQGVADEIAKIKREAETMEGLMDQKNTELKIARSHARSLERDCNQLLDSMAEMEGQPKQRDDLGMNQEVEELRAEAERKDREIRVLQRQLMDVPTAIVGAKTSVSVIEPPDDLEKLAQDVNDIKKIVIEDKRKSLRGLPKRSRTVDNKYYTRAANEQRKTEDRREARRKQRMLEAETEANVRRAEAKIKEIALFVGNEKAELLTFKKRAVTDYEVLTKLLSTLEKNRREWRSELAQNRSNATRKAVLESVKEKLDAQTQTLTKQVGEIKY